MSYQYKKTVFENFWQQLDEIVGRSIFCRAVFCHEAMYRQLPRVQLSSKQLSVHLNVVAVSKANFIRFDLSRTYARLLHVVNGLHISVCCI